MSGIRGMNGNMVNLLQQLPKTGKNGKTKSTSNTNQFSASLQISSSVTSSVSFGNGMRQSSGNYTFTPFYTGDASMGPRIPVPKFTGLTKGEPQMTEDELREAVVNLAKGDKKGGLINVDPTKMNALIDKYICSISPDRAGIINKGISGMTMPANINCVVGQVVDEKTGEVIASYQQNKGWEICKTQEEHEASRPFWDLYYGIITGKIATDVPGQSNASASTSSTTTTTNTKVDYRA